MTTAWWLMHFRSEAKAQALKARVKALDEQERLRRLRMENMGVHVSLRANGFAHASCKQLDVLPCIIKKLVSWLVDSMPGRGRIRMLRWQVALGRPLAAAHCVQSQCHVGYTKVSHA